MQRFNNILLISDLDVENGTALERAVIVARKHQARLTVALVTPPRNRRQVVVQQRRKQLEEFTASVRRHGVRVDTAIPARTRTQEIIRSVLREHHDLVIMTEERKVGLKQRMFGSFSMQLMRKCPCPVWIMKPARAKGFARIVAAVDTDPDTRDDERDALNSAIMDAAISLAHLEQGELHVVHTWTTFAEPLLRGHRRVRQEQVDDWVREDRRRHQHQLDSLLEKYAMNNIRHHVHLLKGEAESLILALAQDKQADLIIMGTVCRTPMAAFLIGNMAERVLQQADCSVLTVKPNVFVSPVKLERPELAVQRSRSNRQKVPRTQTHTTLGRSYMG